MLFHSFLSRFELNQITILLPYVARYVPRCRTMSSSVPADVFLGAEQITLFLSDNEA